jgi:hypothetical protein
MKAFWTTLAGVALAALAIAPLAASVNGAIFTTIHDGTTVNGNIYDAKEDVFLNGGPQHNHGAGLEPDGLYYFQVTDPSGAQLLSSDDIACRVVVVAGGRVSGVPADVSCAHTTGIANAANATLPVQLMPYLDTPNHGGEYKVWLTPVSQYGVACKAGQGSFGFCDSESKTDNFKVRSSAPGAAHVQVCKFNDFNANGVHDGGEPFIAHWPVTASGVDGGLVDAQTNDEGCASFTFSGFSSEVTAQTITISEGSFGADWTQTAPVSCGALDDCSVAAGVITLTLYAGDSSTAPDFGNSNPFCQEGCTPGGIVATATAFASLVRTFDWTIVKSADRTRINSAAPSATVNYTVTMSHDAGTDSDWSVAGTSRIANPGGKAKGLSLFAYAENGGDCEVANAAAAIPAGSHHDFSYRCGFASAPPRGNVKVKASSETDAVEAAASIDFAVAVVSTVDGTVSVTDSMAGELGSVAAAEAGPVTFAYAKEITGTPGTCTVTNNIATSVADTTGRTDSASQAVTLCVGADVLVSQTAATSFVPGIAKTAARPVIQQQGGAVTFNYNVAVTQSGWTVNGAIHVTNPNDWQDVAVTIAESLAGASCVVSTPSITLPAGATIAVPYQCTFTSAPGASIVGTATVAWDGAAAFTPSATAQGSTPVIFQPLSVSDTFNGAAPITIGTVTVPAAVTNFAYARTATNAAPATCEAFTNTATIAGREQSASQTTWACNTQTGAHTIGFWQNKNGQGVITNSPSTGGVCSAARWLRQFTPFQDLAATASCKTVAGYAMTIIKAANASGASMNAMLKAQMLASALDVYFTDAGLGGNALGAPVSVGSVRIDLTGICAAMGATQCNGTVSAAGAFGGNTTLTVMQMLTWQNGVSNAGGTSWYGNVKTIQGLAKNAFDAINNQVAAIPR